MKYTNITLIKDIHGDYEYGKGLRISPHENVYIVMYRTLYNPFSMSAIPKNFEGRI